MDHVLARRFLPCVLASLALLAVPENQLSAMQGRPHGAILRVHLVDRSLSAETHANAALQASQQNPGLPASVPTSQAAEGDAYLLDELARPTFEGSDRSPSPVSSWLGTLTLSDGVLPNAAAVRGFLGVEGAFASSQDKAGHFSAVTGLVSSEEINLVGHSGLDRHDLALVSEAEVTRSRPAAPTAAARLVKSRIDYKTAASDYDDKIGAVTWLGRTVLQGEANNSPPTELGATQSDTLSFALLVCDPLVTGQDDCALTAERPGHLFTDRTLHWYRAGRRLAVTVFSAAEERGTALAPALEAMNRRGAAQAPAAPDRSDLTAALPKAIEQRVQEIQVAENYAVVQLIERNDLRFSDAIKVSGQAQSREAQSPALPPLHQQGETVLVQLGALAGLLNAQFEPQELAHTTASSARYSVMPLDELLAADIPSSYDAVSQQLQLNLVAAQAGSGETAAGISGLGGGSAIKRNLTATASAGFDDNPFLSPNGDAEAASVRLQLAPSLSYADARNTVRLGGRLEHIEYLRRYSSLQNYGADLSGSHRINERLQATGGLLFNSSILATNLANPFFQNDDLIPTQPVPPVGNDVTLLGQQQRRTQYGADGGLRYRLSERDELQWSSSFRADRFGGAGLTESDFFSQQLRYSRQVNGGLNVGAIVDASIINFSDPAFGDARTITPQLLVTTSLSPRLEASGSVGVAFTRLGSDPNVSSNTALSGNLSLCYKGDLSGLCLTGARQVLPSAIGGARLQTTAGVTYSLRMSERETLQLGGNYATASQPLADFGGGDFESINGFARYERRLDERMRLFVSGGFLKTSGNLQGNASNVQGLVGIIVDFGSAR